MQPGEATEMVKDPNGQTATRTIRYDYDDLYRLRGETYEESGAVVESIG